MYYPCVRVGYACTVRVFVQAMHVLSVCSCRLCMHCPCVRAGYASTVRVFVHAMQVLSVCSCRLCMYCPCIRAGNATTVRVLGSTAKHYPPGCTTSTRCRYRHFTRDDRCSHSIGHRCPSVFLPVQDIQTAEYYSPPLTGTDRFLIGLQNAHLWSSIRNRRSLLIIQSKLSEWTRVQNTIVHLQDKY